MRILRRGPASREGEAGVDRRVDDIVMSSPWRSAIGFQ